MVVLGGDLLLSLCDLVVDGVGGWFGWVFSLFADFRLKSAYRRLEAIIRYYLLQSAL